MTRNLYAASHAWIVRDSRVLVTKRSSTTRYMPDKWDIPGGTIEWGESPEDALRREISEETQIQIEIGTPVFVYNNMVQFPERQTLQIVFACKFVSGDVKLHEREHQEFKWIDKEGLRDLDCINFVRALLESPAVDQL